MSSPTAATNNHTPLLLHALLGSWTALINLTRKGSAHKIATLAIQILGAATFASALDDMLEGFGIVDPERKLLAQNGVVRIPHAGTGGVVTRDEQREMAVEFVAGLVAVLVRLRRAGHGDVVRVVGESLVGEEEFEVRVGAKMDGFAVGGGVQTKEKRAESV